MAEALLLVVLLRGTDRRTPGFVRLVQVFAAGTVVFWAVRAPMILLADHPGPFKVVHAVLAAGSVTAAVCAWRAVARLGDFGHAENRTDPTDATDASNLVGPDRGDGPAARGRLVQ